MRYFALVSSFIVTSCASVTAIPLRADGQYDGTVLGIRYYLPKPYILITELPVSPMSAATPAAPASGSAMKGAGSSGGQEDKAAQTAQANVPTSAATDLSFSAAMTSYSIKLVYLPDYSHPMALQEHSGLFGNVALSPTLADGWMLNSLSSSNDSGGAAALSAVASLVGSAVGGATTGGAGKVVSSAGGGALAAHQNDEVDLRSFDKGVNNSGTDGHAPAQPATRTITKTVTRTIYATQPSWGENVLPAGLYAFDVIPNQGELFRLKPIAFFCGTGPEVPVLSTTNTTGGSFSDLYVTPCKHPKIDK